MKIDKKNEKRASSKMVRSIRKGDNVAAYKLLEKLMKQKIASRIDKILKDSE
jgi:hypothetical protein